MWDGSTCMFPAKSEDLSPILRTHSLERAITHYLFCDIHRGFVMYICAHTCTCTCTCTHVHPHAYVCTHIAFSNLDLFFIHECFCFFTWLCTIAQLWALHINKFKVCDCHSTTCLQSQPCEERGRRIIYVRGQFSVYIKFQLARAPLHSLTMSSKNNFMKSQKTQKCNIEERKYKTHTTQLQSL